MCLYEPINGRTPSCNGVCKRGPCNYCQFYYEDPIVKVMEQWKQEAGVDSPILWKHDQHRNKICLYTTKPGYFIGLNGERYQKFHNMLKEVTNDQFFRNGIDIIEVEEAL